jgi:plasmid maintenance system antidote protein VapI
MNKRTERRRGGITAAETSVLQLYRLEADLTYRELAKAMGLALSKVYQLLHDPHVVANERTAFKVRRFLQGLPTRRARQVAAR